MPKIETQDIVLNFHPIDIDFSFTNLGPAIRLFGVTQDRKKIILFDRTFRPYFYASLKQGVSAEQFAAKLNVMEFEHSARKIKISSEKISESELKIYVETPADVPVVQDRIKQFSDVQKIEEYDIRFYRRYMIDREIVPFALYQAICKPVGKIQDCDAFDMVHIKTVSTDLIKPKILAFDIETLSTGQNPDPKNDTIITLAFYGPSFKKIITWKRFDAPDYVSFVNGEQELIDEFQKTIRNFAPDVLVGYGSDNFDFPFLKARATKYNSKLNINLDGSEIIIKTRGRRAAKTSGFQHIDLVHFVRNIISIETSRFKLDAVAKELVGEGKSKAIDVAMINEIWASGDSEELKNLAEYNLTDAQLTFDLAKKILPTQLQLLKLLNLNLFDINRMTYGQLVEWFLIKNAAKFNIRVPVRPKLWEIFERRKKTYAGAYVVEPKPGFYKNLVVFDFRSLYPSIIASHNISPETLKCACCSDRGKIILEDKEELWFCTKKVGFFSELVKDIIERKKRIGQILADTNPNDPAYTELQARQYAIKHIAASLYGYMGYPGSRWYSLECARAVTMLGRKYIQQVIKAAEKFSLNVTYGDTDSLFLENVNKEDAKKFLDIINSTLPKPMELELRGFYPSGIFLERKTGEKGAKKRYALLTESNTIVMKGLEAIRGDWSGLAKKAQRKVIELILKTGDVEKASDFIKTLISNVNDKKISFEDFIISIRLTKDLINYAVTSPHVAAATLAQKKGCPVGRGYVANYIISKGGGEKISDKVKLAEDASLDDCDFEYYIENQILRSVFKIFEIFNYPIEKFKVGQTTLA